MIRIEKLILSQLIHNENFTRKVLPYIKSKYFEDGIEQLLFLQVEQYVQKYNGLPTKEALLIELNQKEGLQETQYDQAIEYVESIVKPESLEVTSWLLEQTETFCQDRAIYLAVVESISILDGKNTTLSKGILPELLSDALSVSFILILDMIILMM